MRRAPILARTLILEPLTIRDKALLTEWQVRLDASDIRFVHARRFAQMALPLCTFS